jgi:hypothetical protein
MFELEITGMITSRNIMINTVPTGDGAIELPLEREIENTIGTP